MGSWLKSHKRRIIQLFCALLYNARLRGFRDGSISRGSQKGICVPGLNCYSCPGAIAACPLGTLQNSIAALPRRIPFYIIGVLLLFGLFFGRVICGFLCPFGLLQELIDKIPFPKIRKNRFTYWLSKLKYVILLVTVFAVPLYFGITQGISYPAFCKYICPAGTLEGAIPLLSLNRALRSGAGALFNWKIIVLIAVLVCAAVCYRFFCRFLCPLGALYSLFAGIAFLGIEVDEAKCSGCGRCRHHCRVDIQKPGDHECIQCGSCMDVCKEQAIHWKTYGKFSIDNSNSEVED